MKKSILNSGLLFAFVLFCLTLCRSVELRGQNLNASISGTVTDPSGATVPNAEMTLRSVSTGTETKVKSGPDGLFNILNLPQGTYDLTVSAQGFRDYVQRGIAVNLNEKIRIDVKLELGEAKQVIEVQADASPLNFDTGEVKGAVAPQTLEELPLIVGGITRSAVSFVRLLPGVTSAGGDDRRNFETRVNGGMNEGDEAILDGISIVDGALSQNGIELAVTGMPFSPEAISEISLLTSNYEPQYGTTSSSVLTAVTKSGTNEFHGSLYEFYRDTVLNARQFGVPKRPRDLENEFGGTIGGPMKIPKIFWTPTKKTYFFVNRTQYYLRGGVSSPVLSIPSLKERQGDFTDWVDTSGNLIPVYDPATTRANPNYNPSLPVGPNNLPMLRDQFMGCDGKTPNVICSSDPRLQASRAQEWLKYLPNPTFSTPLNNYVVPVPRTTTVIADSTVMDIKVDHYWKDKDRFSAVVHYFGSGYDKNTNLPREIDPGDHRSPNYDFYDRGNWDHTFRPNLLNSFNIGYNDIYSISVCEDAEQAGSVPQIKGVLSHELPPVIGFQDFYPFGCNSRGGTVRPAWVANDLVTWVKGKHNLKFGGEFRALQHNITGRGNQSGSFSFSRLNTGLLGINSGNSIASFLLGTVASGSMNYQTVDAQYARMKVYAFHAGDTWKMTPKFSLNYGLRYDISTPTVEKYDNLSFLDPNGSNPGAGGRPGRLVFAGTKWGAASYGKSHPEETYYKAFAPRVGIAYSLSNKTVVRAGYGVFFLTLSYPSWTSGISPGTDGFNSNIVFSSSNGGITPAFLLQDGFPQNFTPPPFIDPTFRNGKSIGLYRPLDGGRPTYSQQWNLTIEREFTKDFYMTAAYVGNKGTRVLSTVAPINALNPSLLSMGQQLYDQFQPGQTVLDGVSIPYAGWVEQMTECPPSVAQALLPYPQYCGNLQGLTENAGNSTFHSLQLKAEKRFAEGMWLLSSYTWSKNLSSGNDIQSFANTWSQITGSISPYERQRNKALDLADVPHTWSLALVYQLPFGKGRSFLNKGGLVDKVFGGWQISTVARVQSGTPFYFRSFGQCNVPGQFSAACVPAIRPGANPFLQDGGDFDPNKPLFNKDAFESPDSFNFYYGKGPRVSNVRGFSYHNNDIGILKNTKISERMTFQVRGEFVNVWNWHIFTGGGTWGGSLGFNLDVASPNFGLWDKTVSSPRNIQIAAKFIF